MREPLRGVSRTAFLAGLLVQFLAVPAPAARAADGSSPYVDARLGALVRRAVERASERLATPGCSLLLMDFVDGRTGRPLAETLAASGRTPSTLFASLQFYDADHMVQCRWRNTWAWLAVGGDVVFVCQGRFNVLARKDQWLAANILVHEALHSLGLGENPPTSEEITAAVIRRCGR
jgi:hypothetical protein